MLPWLKPPGQTGLGVEAEKLVARLEDDSGRRVVELDRVAVVATFYDLGRRPIGAPRIRATGQLRQQQRADLTTGSVEDGSLDLHALLGKRHELRIDQHGEHS